MRTCVIGDRTTGRNHPPDAEQWPGVFNGLGVTNGHDACLRAHQAVWETITAHTLILEDDAVCVPVDWEYLHGQARQWDVLFLGGQPLGWNGGHELGISRLYPDMPWGRSHAYIIGVGAVTPLLTHTWSSGVPWTYNPSWRDDLNIGYMWPPIAGQAAGHSNTLHIAMPELWWYPEFDAMTARGLNVIDTLTELVQETTDHGC